eukprot:TRINITY_DN27482_c0_g1_i1.p2 TRINITY_DN27482_c0_g1~~TRINITY_DN27482_c0_g1_i1.p2  ORF type:complete len:146 (+),score=45.69 TRINITY_DN27482_c0_g1_i1:79-516(+)
MKAVVVVLAFAACAFAVQVPKIVDDCGGKCPFVPQSASFNVDPTPGNPVTITFSGLFNKDFTSGRFECDNYVKVFVWINAGVATGDACAAGNFKCPIASSTTTQTQTQTINVPSNAIAGSYYSHCKFYDQDDAVYANAKVYFSIA